MRKAVISVLVCLTLGLTGFLYARQDGGQNQQNPFPVIITRFVLLNQTAPVGSGQQPIPLLTIPHDGLYRLSATITGQDDAQDCFEVVWSGFPNGEGAVGGCLDQFTNFGGSTAIVPLKAGDSVGYYTIFANGSTGPINLYSVVEDLGKPGTGGDQQ
jgi:hypothetical protein